MLLKELEEARGGVVSMGGDWGAGSVQGRGGASDHVTGSSRLIGEKLVSFRSETCYFLLIAFCN